MTIQPTSPRGPAPTGPALAALTTAPVFVLVALVVLVVLASAACTDLPSASELSHAQVLAVRARPAAVPYGERAQLDYLVAGPAGPIDSSAAWTAQSPGSIELDADGSTWFRAPSAGNSADSADSAEVVAVDLALSVGTDTSLRARKFIAVGVPGGLPGPTLTRVRIGDAEMRAGDELSLPVGEPQSLSIVLADGSRGEGGEIAWYATVGELDGYRSAAAELTLPEDAAPGWLYAVYRDTQGGVDWAAVRIRAR